VFHLANEIYLFNLRGIFACKLIIEHYYINPLIIDG